MASSTLPTVVMRLGKQLELFFDVYVSTKFLFPLRIEGRAQNLNRSVDLEDSATMLLPRGTDLRHTKHSVSSAHRYKMAQTHKVEQST